MRSRALGVVFSLGVSAASTVRAAALAGAAATSPPAAAAHPIELDAMGLGGVTEAPREALPSATLRVGGLALLSIADGIGAGAQLRAGPFGLRTTFGYE